jgi:hypothetical protein
MPHKKALRPLNVRDRSLGNSPDHNTERMRREVHLLSKALVQKDKEITKLTAENDSIKEKDAEIEALKQQVK